MRDRGTYIGEVGSALRFGYEALFCAACAWAGSFFGPLCFGEQKLHV